MFVHYIWYQGWEYSRFNTRIKENEPKWSDADLKIKKWDQNSIETLIKTSYPDYIKWFVSLQTTIAKCDVARAFILHAEGGIYADCDFDPKTEGIKIFLQKALDTNKVVFPGQKPFGLNNYLIAAPPNSLFWFDEYIPAVKQAFQNPRLVDLIVGVRNHTWPVVSTTGPVLLSRITKHSQTSLTTTEHPDTWGRHGAFGTDDKNSSWYVHSTSMKQQYVVDTILFFAILGLLSIFYLFYKYVCFTK